ncbi:hypothetical protein OAL09_05290 [Verrucomicrobia bacterium]|nr:hypothetical protein [Verrucomicrobiota bacterium]
MRTISTVLRDTNKAWVEEYNPWPQWSKLLTISDYENNIFSRINALIKKYHSNRKSKKIHWLTEGIPRDSVKEAAKELSSGVEFECPEATKYHVIIDEKVFSVKEIIGYAAVLYYNAPLLSHSISTGKNSICFNKINEAGLVIREKSDVGMLESEQKLQNKNKEVSEMVSEESTADSKNTEDPIIPEIKNQTINIAERDTEERIDTNESLKNNLPYHGYTEDHFRFFIANFECGELLKSTPIENLFGTKLKLFESKNIHTVGQLLELGADNLISMKYMGKGKLRLIQETLSKIKVQNDQNGNVSIDKPISLPETFCGSFHLFIENFKCGDLIKCIRIEDLFGTKLKILKTKNIHTVGELIELGADKLISMGMGKIKQKLIQETLSKIKVSTDENGNKFLDKTIGQSNSYLSELHKNISSLPLDSIHLKMESRSLRKNDLHTIGDLIKLGNHELLLIPGLGKKKLTKIHNIIEAVISSSSKDGVVDWEKFTEKLSIPMIPVNSKPMNGHQFIDSIQEISQNIIDSCDREVEKVILEDRLLKANKQQKTLEKLGSKFEITRERIRQLEKNILTTLSDGILYDEYEDLQYRVRPEFSKYFREAANKLSKHKKDITFEKFILTLSETWGIGAERINSNWAFISAVLSNKSRRSQSMQMEVDLPFKLAGNLPDFIKNKPIKEFNLGKNIKSKRSQGNQIEEFDDLGIATLGKAIEETFTGSLKKLLKPKTYTILKQILSNIDKTVTKFASSKFNNDYNLHQLNSLENKEEFWIVYAKETELIILPENEIKNPEDFLTNLKDHLEYILDNNHTWNNLATVFRLRTSQPKNKRLTHELVSSKLGIHQVGSVRLEGELIHSLHSQLIDRNFTKSELYYRESFLKYWKEADEAYQLKKNFYHLQKTLSEKWSLSNDHLNPYIDMIWNILNRYPHGRNIINKRKKGIRKKTKTSSNVNTSGTIKLRGFRKIF